LIVDIVGWVTCLATLFIALFLDIICLVRILIARVTLCVMHVHVLRLTNYLFQCL
jgi:hypothetical protein